MSTGTVMLFAVGADSPSGFRSASSEEIMGATRRVVSQRFRRGAVLESPSATRHYLIHQLAERGHEVFAVLFLDNRHRLIECQEMFRGTIEGASVHPREVVKEALRLNAVALILGHNHPSGVCERSQADELMTRRLREALALVDICVLDHLLDGNPSVTLRSNSASNTLCCTENLAKP